MRQNRTSVWKVMTIGISRELPMCNFEHLDILCAWIGHPCDKLCPFEFLDTIRCSISSVSIYYVAESDFRLKSYDHLNFSRALVVQFRVSRYIMHLNRTSVWQVMTIWISREHSLFNFEHLDILCAWIGLPCDKLLPFEFLKSFRCSISSFSIYYAPESDFRVTSYDHLNFSTPYVVQFRASRYIMRLNRMSVWQVMTIWVSRELSLFNFQLLDILCAWIGLPCEKLWPLEFLESFRCSISSVSIYYAPESDFRVTCYDHCSFSWASVVQFQASRYIMWLNRTSIWKVMTIWISLELWLINFERVDMLCTWIGLPCDKLWPFEFLESIRCSISSILIYYASESDFRVTSYDHLNFSKAFVVQFWASRYIMRLNRTSVWQVRTIGISREPPMLNFELLDILCAWIGHPCDKLWPIEFLESFRFSIQSISISDAPESEFRVKSCDHWNFSRASDVQFRASECIMYLNRISVWQVMTIWISREHSLFNF